MSYKADHLSTALRKARVDMGLSQRELSSKSGVPQAQISKFENGAVDLRLSSLVALFRALGLELELVPNKAVPAVQSIVRSTTLRATIDPDHLASAQIALDHVLQELAKGDHRSKEFERLQEHADFFKRVRIPIDQINSFKRWAKYLERLQKSPIDSERFARLMKRTEEFRRQLEHTEALPDQDLRQRSVYSLEEEDGNA
ncbi:MAG: helix-turn-helix transcriptional regulator [Rhodothermaceae bacterium]|nr:helix-turn-helix transcriptional regulator [Bacteroidota bacterium]MDE2672975.1 helix-turn-helix transcriptional regulator [Bacteroidota bacterium]MXY08427.1 helix-turn-helix transcriptional regulator [Rhodothermaceae bacterium]MYF63741.1 helix-turn-helix transcriptional regulator [Rhodothermaceae bacterium]MYI84377.1 helix-turn-helix transcriptional regulator [Rhodothermaceae bacterium]